MEWARSGSVGFSALTRRRGDHRSRTLVTISDVVDVCSRHAYCQTEPIGTTRQNALLF